MMNNSSKEKLLKQIQAYDFAMYDTLLYLDAYPDSKEAQSFYNKYSKLSMRAKQEYEQKYGSLTMPRETENWQWTKGPWPWQNEERR